MRYDWAKKTDVTINTGIDSNDIAVYDILGIDWSKFQFGTTYIIHSITKNDVEKPWLITNKYFSDYKYEDLIFWINNISNPLDLYVGQKLRIPTLQDIQNFILSINKEL